MNWKAKIEVMLKKEVLDPQGAAVNKVLGVLGYHNIKEVRVGKYLELNLSGVDRKEAGKQVEEMCRRILTNPVIEEFSYNLVEGE